MAIQKFGNQIMKPRHEANEIKKLLFDSDTALTMAPVQAVKFSIAFIFMIFLLHTLSRIFPSIPQNQLFVSVFMVFLSIGVSLSLNKK